MPRNQFRTIRIRGIRLFVTNRGGSRRRRGHERRRQASIDWAERAFPVWHALL